MEGKDPQKDNIEKSPSQSSTGPEDQDDDQQMETCDEVNFLESLDTDVKKEYIRLKGILESATASDSQEEQGDSNGLVKECQHLLSVLKNSLMRESNLKLEMQTLKSKMTTNSLKMQQLQKISTSDSESQDFLKREIDAIQEELEDACERERHQRNVADKLRIEIQHLSRSLEEMNIKETESERQLQEISDQRDRISAEKERVQEELMKSQREINDLLQHQMHLENFQSQAESQIGDLKAETQKLKLDIESEKVKKEKIESDLAESKDIADMKTDEIKNFRNKNLELDNELNRTKDAIKIATNELNLLQSQHSSIKKNNEELRVEVEVQFQRIQDLEEELESKNKSGQNKDAEIRNLESEVNRIQNQKSQYEEEIRDIVAKKSGLEDEKKCLEKDINEVAHEFETSQKNLENERKKYADATREKNIIAKNLLKAGISSQKQNQLLKLHENSKKTLEVEIQNFREEAQNQRKAISQLERERDRYISEASELSSKINCYLDLIRDKDSELSSLKKQITDLECKLRQQRTLYENARNDRNTCSKNLTETQDQIVDSRKQLKILAHQVEQLKEEITNSEMNLAREKTDRQKAERERESLRNEVNRVLEKAKDAHESVEKEKSNKIALETKLSEVEHDLIDSSKELSKLNSTRDLLGSQLVKKSKEVELLCEKINIQNIILSRGEQKYKERLEDIKILKLELKRVNSELINLEKSSGNIKEQKMRLAVLEKQLNAERTARQALEKASETPLNVHRWRKLEAGDPSHFELIQKTHILQKLLIKRGADVEKKGCEAEELRKEVKNMRDKLKRMPGEEIKIQCEQFKKAVVTKETE